MRLKTKVIIATAVGAAALGAAVTVTLVKRRARRVLNRKLRRTLSDIVKMRGEDFIPGGKLGKSLFRRYIDNLDNKQLVALCALVQVGYFVKVSGIDPMHATKEQVKQAVAKYMVEERLAPLGREELLLALDTSDAHDALTRAFGVLAKA